MMENDPALDGEVVSAVRRYAAQTFGGNCAFADDDAKMLAHFASWAIDQGYRGGISDRRTLRNIERAAVARKAAS